MILHTMYMYDVACFVDDVMNRTVSNFVTCQDRVGVFVEIIIEGEIRFGIDRLVVSQIGSVNFEFRRSPQGQQFLLRKNP